LDVLLGRRTLLLADDDHGASRELGDTPDDRGVVTEGPVAVQLLKSVERARDDVEGVRPADVPRGLHRLPGRGSGGCERGSVGDEPRLDREVTVLLYAARVAEAKGVLLRGLGAVVQTSNAVETGHDQSLH